jgi:mannose-6-phosphate isomerase-like protein (cupin superfamily)
VKIALRQPARFSADRMVKVTLAATPRLLLDLYCLEPGQEQKAHVHAGQDKLYLVLEGRAHITVEGQEDTVGPGEAVLARAGQPHGLSNPGPDRLLVAVVVSPPPPHA